jgi:pyruvate/2-oxoglutarate dehydrogenase complex dihydrolipoamide dehydrogenase (E3) component
MGASETRDYDVVVLGAGPTGENVAERAVRGGLRVVIVEKELVGGECSFWACMPSKALLRPLQALTAARAVAGSREAVSGDLDAGAVLARRDSFASHWKDDGQVKWLRDSHIDLVRGHGRLDGERRVIVESTDGKTTVELRARRAVAICTGTRAAMPPIPGLADVRPWTSREATSATRAPRSLVVIGGGVVACEMATAWHGLGTEEITLLQRGPRLIPGCEDFAGEILAEALRARGILVLTDTSATRVEKTGTGVRVHLPSGDAIAAEQVLVAAGRTPQTDDIGLESMDLEPGQWLEVDEQMGVRGVAGEWLYAAGDVNHRALLTHMGKYQARVCGDVIAARARGESIRPDEWSRHAATADRLAVPQVVFTEPEVAAVGFTEAQARERGLEVRVVDYEIGRVAGASLHADDYAGRARLVIDERRGVVVGATLVGAGTGELLHAATIAVVGEVPLDRLWHAVPSYPTVSEVWLRLLETAGL